jgi:hypothetical protein
MEIKMSKTKKPDYKVTQPSNLVLDAEHPTWQGFKKGLSEHLKEVLGRAVAAIVVGLALYLVSLLFTSPPANPNPTPPPQHLDFHLTLAIVNSDRAGFQKKGP